jgi:uncharacterized protein (TIGR01777 family)
MKIIIPGGTGQVGTLLAREFHKAGHEVVVLSRTPQKLPWKIIIWDAKTLGDWVTAIDNSDIVINLAGRSVNCRYSPANRKLILDSRVQSTLVIGNAIAQANKPPKVWLQASTATIYAHRFDAANNEATGIIGGGEPNAPDTWKFSIEVAKAWENAANEISTPNTRKVLLRSAMTMSPDKDGIFDTLLNLTKLGLGGTAGNGQQFVSWIHEYDFIQAIHWIIQHEEINGAINLSSPNPLPYSEFMQQLRKACGVSIGLPATKWMLEIGAFFMKTETELILKSRRVIPSRLLQAGFQFKYPAWREAALELYKKKSLQKTLTKSY